MDVYGIIYGYDIVLYGTLAEVYGHRKIYDMLNPSWHVHRSDL